MDQEGAATELRVERPGKTLRELALGNLRDAILHGVFRPGDRLVERDLVERMGVSRTIVREALRHLESEGLVSTEGSKGPIVARLDLAVAEQIYEVRGALEAMAARLCAEADDPTIVPELEAALAGIRAGYAAHDLAEVLNQTSEFYRILFGKVNRDVAWDIVKLLTVRINHLRSMTIQTENRNVEGPAQMARIVEAIRDRDGERAAAAARDHVRRAASIAREVFLASRDERID
ncbi:GntR family transcriptional regulator [Aquamicrobium terrae]|uniref:DNA-binding GntR family transcriptional regulator n=1 Tax=Aquamicrobium terrae TaxID=1324945 RepID=A0ABV2N049_9HYPH